MSPFRPLLISILTLLIAAFFAVPAQAGFALFLGNDPDRDSELCIETCGEDDPECERMCLEDRIDDDDNDDGLGAWFVIPSQPFVTEVYGAAFIPDPDAQILFAATFDIINGPDMTLLEPFVLSTFVRTDADTDILAVFDVAAFLETGFEFQEGDQFEVVDGQIAEISGIQFKDASDAQFPFDYSFEGLPDLDGAFVEVTQFSAEFLPIPEPSTAALLAVGLGALVVARVRIRRVA